MTPYEKVKKANAEKLATIPKFHIAVRGHRVLVEPLPALDQFGQIILIDETKQSDKLAVTLGYVLQVGELCWKDLGKAEPWCKVGDMVLFQRYGGARVHDPVTTKYRDDVALINDQDIQGVVTGYDEYKDAYLKEKEAGLDRVKALRTNA